MEVMWKQVSNMIDPGASAPLPYTSSLLELLRGDAILIKDILVYFPLSFPGVLQPFWSIDRQNELSLVDSGNVGSLLLHFILIPIQISFLLNLFYVLLFPVPAAAYIGGIVVFLVLNVYVCKLLNQPGEPHISTIDLSHIPEQHDDECWIFINGVSVGRHWLQANLNALSSIFGRRIIGIHNPTYGIIFDLLECIIQRDCNFVTDDIRRGYAEVKKNLLDQTKRKVVLIAHSQGGIEAGAILDWLLDDLPSDIIGKLEIYTFGSAANHFNNPCRTSQCSKKDDRRGVVGHIEHYTNSGEFVSRFGILGFVQLPPGTSIKEEERKRNPKSSTWPSSSSNPSLSNTPRPPPMSATFPVTNAEEEPTSLLYKRQHNRFNGILFNHNVPGHMMNQHYLATMFKRESYTTADGRELQRVADHNDFMDSAISAWDGEKEGQSWGWPCRRKREDITRTNAKKKRQQTNGGRFPQQSQDQIRDPNERNLDEIEKRGRSAVQNMRRGKGKGQWSTMALENGVDLLNALGSSNSNSSNNVGIVRPRDVSRLWTYRNGMSPDDNDDDND